MMHSAQFPKPCRGPCHYAEDTSTGHEHEGNKHNGGHEQYDLQDRFSKKRQAKEAIGKRTPSTTETTK